MIKNFLLLGVVVIALTACKKNETPNPSAGFSLSTSYLINDTASFLTVAVYDGFNLTNNSANASSYLWDFGDGSTSKEKHPNYAYTKPGIYTLTLTVFSSDGKKSVESKTIKVVEPVAKQVVVTSLNPKSALGWASTYPTAAKIKIWVEILEKVTPDQQYPLSGYGIPLAPLVYKSAAVSNIDASKVPLSLDISNKLTIDIPIYASGGYIFNLYGQDNTDTYLIASSYGSAIGSSMEASILQNKFVITTGFEGSSLKLVGSYE